MRDDFDRVVIERPRWGSWRSNLKTGWSTSRFDPDQDYAPPAVTRGRMKTKEFSDLLGPLFRFLEKQVGRPWRKVEGELLGALDLGTITGKHLWDHAVRFVETNARMRPDGHAYTLRGYPVRDLFVHPRSGLLLRQRPWKSDPAKAFRKRLADAHTIRLDARTVAEKLDGLWYLFVDEARTEEVTLFRKDSTGRKIAYQAVQDVVRKKQANTEEVRRIRAALEAGLR